MMKKTLFIFLLIVPLLLAACSKSDESTIKNLSEMELAANQELVTAQVTARVGNDLELALGTLGSSQGTMGAMPSGEAGAMPSGGGQDGAMPSGERPSGGGQGGGQNVPSGERTSGGGPGGAMPSDAAALGDTSAGDIAAADGSTAGASAQINLSGETMSLTIPVGTKVLVTSNSILTSSSFGRIQVDDILQLIVQTNADGSQTVIEAQIME